MVWYVKWVWRYSVKGEEYSEEDKLYITRRKLKLSETHWKVYVCVCVCVCVCGDLLRDKGNKDGREVEREGLCVRVNTLAFLR